MQAKLNVQSGSAYAHLNGKFFEVVEILGSWGVALRIDGITTDFRMTEIEVIEQRR